MKVSAEKQCDPIFVPYNILSGEWTGGINGVLFINHWHRHPIFLGARSPYGLQMFSSVASKWFKDLGGRKMLNGRAVQTKVPAWPHLIWRLSYHRSTKGMPALSGITPKEVESSGWKRQQPDCLLSPGFQTGNRKTGIAAKCISVLY